MSYVLCVLAGMIAGGALGWLLASVRVSRSLAEKIEAAERRAAAAEGRATGLEGTLAEVRIHHQKMTEELAGVREQLSRENAARVQAETRLAETVQRLEEEKNILAEARARLGDAFKSLAGDALKASTESFLQLARETFEKVLTEARGDLGKRQEAIEGMVKPLVQRLFEFNEHVRGLEKTRQEAYAGLLEQLRMLASHHQQLQKETANLATALRRPEVRGRWGEMTLHRVVEIAGMSEHCDFEEQVPIRGEDGPLRPDMVVRLPAGRVIVVDAKVSLEAYLDAVGAESQEARAAALKRHAEQIRSHVARLADRGYWAHFDNALDFVVLFIPGESFFSAAVDVDRELVEYALKQRVVIATPTTLLALLRAVAYGWRQEKIATNAQEISALGKELYERMQKLAEYVGEIGRGLERTTAAYNRFVGSLEGRVLPTVRRFERLGVAADGDIPQLPPVETSPRALTAPELKADREE